MHSAGAWRVKVGGGLVLLLSLVASGCIKRDSFPPEPTLKFKSFTQFGDSASLVVLFTDGDGDIGLDDSDNQPPFNVGSDYYYNLFLEYEEYRSATATWVPISLALPFRYRIPRITPTGQNKALEGEIAVALAWPVIPDNVVDTVRFQVRLVDRALRESNRVPTDAIIEAN